MTESFDPGRLVLPLMVLECWTTGTTGCCGGGGDLDLMGHTTAAVALVVVASRLLLEKVIFLMSVELATGLHAQKLT